MGAEDYQEDVEAASESSPEQIEETQDIQDVKDEVEVSSGSTPASEGEDVKQPESEDVDEKGVPWKNREAEIRRKAMEELQPYIRQQIQEGIQQATKQQSGQEQPQTPKSQYTLEQLNAVLADQTGQYDQYKAWAQAEKDRLILDEAEQRAISKFQKNNEKLSFEQAQQQAIGYIEQTYGQDAFVQTPMGKQWNAASPLYQRAVQIYQSDAAFKNSGRGLAGAFDMAFGQIAREQSLNLTKEKTKLTAQKRRVEKEQSKAMAAGGKSAKSSGVSAQSKLQQLMAEHSRTKDPKVFAEILRMRGLMPTA